MKFNKKNYINRKLNLIIEFTFYNVINVNVLS